MNSFLVEAWCGIPATTSAATFKNCLRSSAAVRSLLVMTVLGSRPAHLSYAGTGAGPFVGILSVLGTPKVSPGLSDSKALPAVCAAAGLLDPCEGCSLMYVETLAPEITL